MPKLFKSVTIHEPTKKGTSIGRKPAFSTMNKNKRRSFKKYRGQGKTRWVSKTWQYIRVKFLVVSIFWH